MNLIFTDRSYLRITEQEFTTLPIDVSLIKRNIDRGKKINNCIALAVQFIISNGSHILFIKHCDNNDNDIFLVSR